jgi:hypothetical protein
MAEAAMQCKGQIAVGTARTFGPGECLITNMFTPKGVTLPRQERKALSAAC